MIKDPLTSKIISICYEVHKELGHGYSEKVYENSLAIALDEAGLGAVQQHPINVYFREQLVGEYFADILVENNVILELEALEALRPEHQSQLINYLKGTRVERGLLINFGSPKVEIKRVYHPEFKSA